ncbi:universal stress protein [Cereibacter azotoformans]|uniref:Nucleotide-binding universal stress UspA family protein n=2 Tax=Cereibacter TaxID=1653176 RepID=A0A2T5K602_9RHOB|nr:universal stress protein [Cereibacter azotoformans]AXQ95649.1 universal stress protein [Cereibacter sphaeroides]PTR17843.1 nucleotide-binding universal stress UspA family protein [Cereibacter azotoformans]UIJ32101.1 universal stress protein [Cereibacter azotoformans]ULB12012.1 universal stress protein [Cereibacter azotoformans]
MARTILLPVDLGNPPANTAALAEALKLLEPGGRLHVVSVLPDYGYAQVSGFFRQGYEQEALKALGKALAAWVAEAVPDEVDVHPHVLHGTVYDEILRAAGKLGADLIVIGAHRPELSDYLLGPNAARVVRHARQSVYVVRN